MDEGILDGMVMAALCVIIYYACVFALWGWHQIRQAWKREKKRMDDFSAAITALEIESLERKTKDAENIITPDRLADQLNYNRAMNRMVSRIMEHDRQAKIDREIKQMIGEL